MRKSPAIVVLSAYCCLVGCNSQPPAPPATTDTDFGGWTWYASVELDAKADDVGVSAAWGSWNKKFVYIILADDTTTSTTKINTSGPRTEYVVDLTLPKGRKAEVRIETADGKTGTAVSAGRSYDLARGPVFVLPPRGEKLELLQLNRDISEVTAGVPGVQKLVRNDQELLRMFR